EIMLQQTRVAAAIPYYERFLARFPDLAALAAAPEDEVLACWSGLGYYSRARNMHRAAQLMAQNGGFPTSYEGIRALPGAGDYTAAAVASIAFNLPHAAVDGNVLRVLARLLAERGDIDSARTRRRLREAAETLLDARRPGRFNQAMMELGATVCVPREPRCAACPLADLCSARGEGIERELPVRQRRTEPVRVQGTLLLIRKRGCVLLRRREASSRRMAGFWELPEARLLPSAIPLETVATVRHSITKYRYEYTIVQALLSRAPAGFSWIRESYLERVPLTATARKALRKLAPSGPSALAGPRGSARARPR
ncbi:MAG TPA: NUDIX domain-containing protein, partial [Bryobacteraceae bacterium]|nr:NUDIX domain-containing protein [Bryobacteraceae bacterium]